MAEGKSNETYMEDTFEEINLLFNTSEKEAFERKVQEIKGLIIKDNIVKDGKDATNLARNLLNLKPGEECGITNLGPPKSYDSVTESNRHHALKDRVFFNIKIPGTKEQRISEAAVSLHYFDDEQEKEKMDLAFDKFMQIARQKIDAYKNVLQLRPYETAYLKKELFKKIKKFIKENHNKCRCIYITLMAHGTEAGENNALITTHDTSEILYMNDYISFLKKQSEKYQSIAIHAIVDVCSGHSHDKNLLDSQGTNVTLYPTTNENEKQTYIHYKVTAAIFQSGMVKRVDEVLEAESLKLNKFAEEHFGESATNLVVKEKEKIHSNTLDIGDISDIAILSDEFGHEGMETNAKKKRWRPRCNG